MERQRGQDGNGRGYERAAGKSLLKLHFLRPASSHRRPRRTTASKGVLKPDITNAILFLTKHYSGSSELSSQLDPAFLALHSPLHCLILGRSDLLLGSDHPGDLTGFLTIPQPLLCLDYKRPPFLWHSGPNLTLPLQNPTGVCPYTYNNCAE